MHSARVRASTRCEVATSAPARNLNPLIKSDAFFTHRSAIWVCDELKLLLQVV